MSRFLIVTCFKNEAPFILEWIAYHRAIGFDGFLIYTNDCDDGTDEILGRLSQLGLVEHRNNQRRQGQRPSHQARALGKTLREPIYQNAEWAALIDADEFINIRVGNHHIEDLVAAIPDANTISLAWRLFGNGGQVEYKPGFLIDQFTSCAPLNCPRPAQAWGMKTLHKPGTYSRLGVHRPRVPKGEEWDAIRWFNGSGREMADSFYTSNWRFDANTCGYDLAQVNHYSLRSAQSFVFKQLRGRAFGGMELDMNYWSRMNRNEEQDRSIQVMQPALQKEWQKLMDDAELLRLHETACKFHQARIDEVITSSSAQELLDKSISI